MKAICHHTGKTLEKGPAGNILIWHHISNRWNTGSRLANHLVSMPLDLGMAEEMLWTESLEVKKALDGAGAAGTELGKLSLDSFLSPSLKTFLTEIRQNSAVLNTLEVCAVQAIHTRHIRAKSPLNLSVRHYVSSAHSISAAWAEGVVPAAYVPMP